MLEIKKPQDYSLKNMRKSLKEKGQFYTSEELEGWDFEKYRQFLLNRIENFDK